MRRKTRQTLFFFFLISFCLIAPYLVFYSQGYRFDFEKKKFVQTGGIFLKVLPRQAEVYLNEKLAKKTDPLFGSALIENLLPRKYKVRVEKEGYHPWEKFLEVKEREVTAARNIILIPRELNFNLLVSNVEKFWPSPDLKKFLLKEREKDGWVLKLYDLERNVKLHLINEKEISVDGVDLVSVDFSEDPKEIFLGVQIKEEKKNFLLELDKSPPSREERTSEGKRENVLVKKEVKNNLYFLDVQGNLFKNGIKISEKPFLPKNDAEYQLMIFADQVFLKENEALFYFDLESKSFQKISEATKDLRFSPDSKKVAYFSNHEIWVFFLSEEAGPPKKAAGEKIFIARFSEKIDTLSWVNNYYLIFYSGNKIKIAEIDNRDKINIIDIAEFEDPKIFFNQTTKRIYILGNGNFYQSDILIKSF